MPLIPIGEFIELQNADRGVTFTRQWKWRPRPVAPIDVRVGGSPLNMIERIDRVSGIDEKRLFGSDGNNRVRRGHSHRRNWYWASCAYEREVVRLMGLVVAPHA
jgi:hypothetical protein